MSFAINSLATPPLAMIAPRYEILRKLGEGSVSTLFLVRDSKKSRECVLKLLKENYHQDEEALQRFQFEFITVSRITHPNIIQVYELYPVYYTREYLGGKDFSTLIRADLSERIQVALEIASGLEEIHRRGIIHRDLRPGNLRFTESGTVKILDFSFAFTIDPAFKPLDIRTAPTLDYMAPEQLKGFEIDPRVDLYSLGVILFELVTGKLPFESISKRGATGVKHLETKAPSPRALNPEIPSDLEHLILSCLEKDVSKRIESASDVIEKLKSLSGQSQFVTSKIERGAHILLPPQFVHREAPLAKLLKSFDQAQSKYFKEFVIVTGENGVGKSRFLAEFKQLRQGYEHQFFTLLCLPQEIVPLAPFLQMLESWIKRYPRERLERKQWIEKYGDTFVSLCPSLMKEPDLFRCHRSENLSLADRQRLLLSLLQDLMDTQFVTIFFENLQWCDPDSVEVLETMVNNPSQKRLFLCGTYLGESVQEETPFQRLFYRLKMSRKIQEIPLANLSQAKLNLFIGSMLGQWKVDPKFVARVFQLTQGNPGLVERLLRDLAERGFLYKKGNKITLEITDFSRIEKPAELVDELLVRAQNLNTIFKQFLKVASALDRKINIPLLMKILKLKESQISLLTSDLLKQGFLSLLEEGTDQKSLIFASLKLKEVTYQNIPDPERQKIHTAIAFAMEKLKDADQGVMASHFEKAQYFKKAIVYYLKAAHQEEAKQRYLEAIFYYEKALQSLKFYPVPKQQVLVFERLGDLYRKIAHFSKAVENYKTGLPLAEKMGNSVLFYRGLGEVYLYQGDWRQAYNYFNIQYAQSLKDKRSRGAYEMTQMAFTHLARDSYEKAEELFQNAIQIAKDLKMGSTVALSLSGLGEIHLNRGEWEIAKQQIQEALQLAKTENDLYLTARIYTQLAIHSFKLEQIHKAFKYLEEALYLAESCKDTGLVILLQNYFGELFEFLGRSEKAIQLYREALKTAEEQNYSLGIALSCLHLGRGLASLEKTAESKNYLLRSTTLYEHLGHPMGVALNYVALGTAFLKEGNIEKARSCFSIAEKRLVGLKRENELQKVFCDHTQVLLQMNLREKALSRTQKGLKYALQYEDHFSYGKLLLQMAHYYLAEHDAERAESYFREGVGVLEKLPNKLFLADEFLRYAEALFYLEQTDPQGQMEIIFQYAQRALKLYQQQRSLKKIQQTQQILEEWESFFTAEYQNLSCQFLKFQHQIQKLESALTALLKQFHTQLSQISGDIMDSEALQTLLKETERHFQTETEPIKKAIDELKSQSNHLKSQMGTLAHERRKLLLFERMSHLLNTADQELEALLPQVLDLILEITNAERGLLVLQKTSDPGEEFTFKSARKIGKQTLEKPETLVPQALFKKIISSALPILVEETSIDKELKEIEAFQKSPIKSLMAVPFRIKNRVLGVFYVDHLTQAGAFHKEDLKQFSALADQTAISLENALLYQEVADKERLEQELNLASTIQKRLCAKELPQVEGLQLYGMMQPARKVGGDYYDFISTAPDSLYFCIGDVSGKGIGSGLVMVMAQTALNLLCDGQLNTKAILLKLNQLIYENTDKFIFMSFILFHWNASQNRLTYTAGGHEHILIYRAQTQQIERILAGGTVLGVKEDITEKLTEKPLEIFPQDRIVLYSDGVTEAMNSKKEEFGLEALIETIQENAHKNPKQLTQAILEKIATFRAGTEQSDDITIVVLQKN